MSEDLYSEGITNQVNIDFSPVVIKAMQEKYRDKPGMQCTCPTVLIKHEYRRQKNGYART